MTDATFIGIDLGTQSVRVVAANDRGDVAASASFPLSSKRDGARHEQDPRLWWDATVKCCRAVMQHLRDSCGDRVAIAGLAVDATSGTILFVDDELRVLTPALMYDDGRATQETIQVNEIGNALWTELSYHMQPSWALPKVLWLIQHHTLPKSAHLVHQSDFINALLAGQLGPTDTSHSLKTGYDLVRCTWPTAILDSLDIPVSLFPEVVRPGTRIGKICESAAQQTGLPIGTPIFAGMTDGCAAQIASGATVVGSWNCVLGTTLVIKGVTEDLLNDPLGVVYSHRSANNLWLPGGASSTGAGVLTKEIPGADLDELNRFAKTAAPSDVVIYPLAGEGERFPFAAPQARGFRIGDASTASAINELYLGVLQGVAFIERLSFDYLRHIGASLQGSFSITGGATRSSAWNQIRSNVLQRELHIPETTEPAFGMAILAAAQFSSIDETTTRMVRRQMSISPSRSFSEYSQQYRSLITELVNRGYLAESVGAKTLEYANK